MLEVYFVVLTDNPEGVGIFAIALYLGLIVYFAFRLGIKGGLIAVLMTTMYYFYLIYSRGYEGEQLIASLNTTLILSIIYTGIAVVIGWLKQSIDVHIVREVNAKKRLLTIIKQLPVGIVITDTKGHIQEINTAMKRIIGGHIDSSSKIGSELFQLYSPASKQRINEEQYPLYRALRTGKTITNKELILHNTDEREFNILDSSAPIYDRFNNVVAGVSIFQDVTTNRELEQRKDDFVNMASHELRTPITSLNLYLTYLKKRLGGGDPNIAMRTVARIEKQVDNLMNIISSLLDVSRYQTGKMKYVKAVFRLNELVEEAVDSLKGVSRQQTVRLRKKVRVNVYADRYRINQVLTNLITNAYKYSDGPGEIGLNMNRRGRNIEVAVSDNGPGVPRGQQKKVFEKLYQIHDSKSDTYPGFGMGLYIAREIIRHHKGRIWVESEEGKGATFIFSLPTVK